MTITISPRLLRFTAAVLFVTIGIIAGIAVAQLSAAGAAVEDTAYTAITPSASFDSRTDTGTLAGKYTHNEQRTFQITGAAPADQQGGIDCGIPAGAKAVLVNIVAIDAQTGGNLRAFATGDTGTGGVVNYSSISPGLNNSNAVVIPLSGTGQLDIQNNCGGCAVASIEARGVLLGYYTDSLAARVLALETLLADVTRDTGGPNSTDRLLFTGMNLQLVDGTNTTECTGDDLNGGTTGFGEACNGEGNLIIGYNEETSFLSSDTDVRTGAHNLVIGLDHTYASYAGAVFGLNNSVSDTNATVTGGWSNSVAAPTSSISGGRSGTIPEGCTNGFAAISISGGLGGTASGCWSSITGGDTNTASGEGSSVTAGYRNLASGKGSSVSGGGNNTASADDCTTAFSTVASSVSGGRFNHASGCGASVSGGGAFASSGGNLAQGALSSVTGGGDNTASGEVSTVSGGVDNVASGDDCTLADHGSSVSGGQFNHASGCYSSISGGGSANASEGNTAIGLYSSVAGGQSNLAFGTQAAVAGGENNKAHGDQSAVSGGLDNKASGTASSVTAGWANEATGTRSSVTGGEDNTASSLNASVSGGQGNTASGDYSTVSGGAANVASGKAGSISGGWEGSVADSACASFSGIPAGSISGGWQNRVTGCSRFCPGRAE